MKATKQIILDTATALSEKHGFRNVTRLQIATKAGIASGTVSYHFGTMVELQNAIMSHAVESKNTKILAQGLGEAHPVAIRAPQTLRVAASKVLAGV